MHKPKKHSGAKKISFAQLPPPNFSVFPGLQISGHAVVSCLVCLSQDWAVMVWALTRDIVLWSWARHVTLLLSFSTQVYKWVPVKLCWVTLWWTSIPSRGSRSKKYSKSFHAKESGIVSGLVGQQTFSLPFFYLSSNFVLGGSNAFTNFSYKTDNYLSTTVVKLNKFSFLSCRDSYWHWLKLFGTCVRYCSLKLYQVL